MPSLDQIKHRSNSDTIQASNSFDFHEWAYKTWEMTRCTKQVLRKGCMPCQSIFILDCSKERHVILVGVHQHIFEKSNMFNSFLSLQNLFSSNGLVNISASWSSVPTLSMQMSPFCWWSLMKWWGHQCALFLHVELDCWSTWLHSHCYIAMALSWTWFQSHSKWPSSKVFVHNNYWRICI